MTNKYLPPHPTIKARYPDPSVLGSRIFQSGKNAGRKWGDASKSFWVYMIGNVLNGRPDTDIYLYAHYRATLESPEQTTLGIKDAKGKDVAEPFKFKNKLLESIEPVKGLPSHLLPHQVSGVSALVRLWERRTSAGKRFGALLADDMGLGKTLQAIEFVERALIKLGRSGMDRARVLVICKASLVSNWAAEIRKFSVLGEQSKVTHLNSKVIKTLQKLEENLSETQIVSAGWYVASTDYAWRPKIVSNTLWDFVIYDEAHTLRGIDSKRGTLAHTLKVRQEGGKIFLTGTPIENSAVDVYNFCKACLPDEFAQSNTSSLGISFDEFTNQFTRTVMTDYGPKYVGITNPGKLGDLLSGFCIKRLKAEVDKDMPPLFRNQIILDCDIDDIKELAKTMTGISTVLREYLEAIERGATNAPPPQVAKLRRSIGLAKVTPTVELIKSMREEGEGGALVIFAYHTGVLDKLHVELSKAGETISRIDGSTPTEARGEQVRMFQAGETSIFLGQIYAAGAGLTLTRAKRMLIVEPDFLPSTNLQAEARIHRIGIAKDDKIVVSYVTLARPEVDDMTEGMKEVLGMDERIYKNFIHKANNINRVFDEGEITTGAKVVVEYGSDSEVDEEMEARLRYFSEIGTEEGNNDNA